MNNRVLSAAIFLGLLLGCDSASRTDVVFAVIDGKPLTSSEVKKVVEVKARIAELSGSPIKEQDFPAWGNSLAMQIIPNLISAEVLENEILRRGVLASAEDIAETFESYKKSTRQQVTSVDELVAKFGDRGPAFREQFERSALFTAFWRQNPPATVTDEDVADFYQARSNELKIAQSIDAQARQKGQKAWQRLQNGEDWGVVAADCSEDLLIDEENGEFTNDWATVGLDGFGYPELAKAIVTMKKGDFSKPVETDEGLMIVKVMEKGENAWALGRIIFRMAQPVEFPSEDAVRKQLAGERNKAAHVKLLKRLYEKAKIEFPMGTKFSYKIWK